MKNDTLIFCIPGRTFSNLFLGCWTATLFKCWSMGMQIIIPGWPTGNNIYRVRNLCLQGNPGGSPDQKPFQGKHKYDYIMWIDSDSVWKVEDFLQLYDQIKNRQDIHILTGIYRIPSRKGKISVISDKRQELLNLEQIEAFSGLTKIYSSGLGFCIMRYGVLESIDYPWFVPLPIMDTETKKLRDVAGDDTSLFVRLKQKGFEVWCDPTIRIGHEKSYVFYMEDEIKTERFGL